jgi:hypothetical protein
VGVLFEAFKDTGWHSRKAVARKDDKVIIYGVPFVVIGPSAKGIGFVLFPWFVA